MHQTLIVDLILLRACYPVDQLLWRICRMVRQRTSGTADRCKREDADRYQANTDVLSCWLS